ncbi:MAG: transcriptional regulator MntR [Thaumarchaeota archaeon]|nr:transcriptional regulator MntR [Nitrososphaerota archaeon]
MRSTQLKRETPRVEDYLEAIYHQIHDKGYASTIDLSDKLRVKPPTVSIMLRKLAKDGYLVHEPYRGMRLTEKGGKVARSVITRHSVVYEFLSMIGVEPEKAYQDAEGIEHDVQPVTVHRIERLVEFLRKNPQVIERLSDEPRK